MEINVLNSRIDLGLQYIPELLSDIESTLRVRDNVRNEFVNFNLYPPQKRLLEDYDNYERNVVRKSRQTGVTSATCAWIAKKMVEYRESVFIIASNSQQAYDIGEQVKTFVQQWGATLNANSRKRFTTTNGSSLMCGTTVYEFNSCVPTIIYFDEAAYINSDLFRPLMSQLCLHGKIIMASTPNGNDDFFAYKYHDAPGNGFHRTDIFWYEIPKFNTEGWFENMRRAYNNDDTKLRQEVFAEFITP